MHHTAPHHAAHVDVCCSTGLDLMKRLVMAYQEHFSSCPKTKCTAYTMQSKLGIFSYWISGIVKREVAFDGFPLVGFEWLKVHQRAVETEHAMAASDPTCKQIPERQKHPCQPTAHACSLTPGPAQTTWITRMKTY